MKRSDFLILLLAVLVASGWVIFSGRNGFSVSNAMIVARSISVISTIDGRVERAGPPVGSEVTSNQLLALIRNGRIDRARSAELESRINFLQTEIANAQNERKGLVSLLRSFEKRGTSFSDWRIEDLRLEKSVTTHELNAAIERNTLKTKEVERTASLFKKSYISSVNLEIAETEAQITRSQVEAARAKLSRIKLLLQTAESKNTFFGDGETSYWAKTIDALNLRVFDNANRISTLRAQLEQTQAQAKVESKQIKTNFVEEHRAPFDGIVNAVFVTTGSRVNSGTPLLQVLDCSQPIAIVPIPEHRFGEFSVGQRVTVNPIDSDKTIDGTIKLVSSGPLLGRDKTITVQQDMTLSGNNVIVGFDEQDRAHASPGSCDSARKAIVTIHTKSLFDKIAGWFQGYFPEREVTGNLDGLPEKS